ncbi:L,D-transpeptidase family protein [Hyphomicrobium sp. CS1GBMeth3]|uniref:L,D-transpeptidase family protein n=1 Tax=Hyphomicrobium sp. CS1GBMeth3 TaxID=1892845 RepID=UPI0009F825EC|nr:L,D-transpeptidase family protein [Hyphomicrobium sp. CS1GBMeth3]
MRSLSPGSTKGRLVCGNLVVPCALGRSGTRSRKREGDGATPRGTFRLESAFFRRDKLMRPGSALPLMASHPDDGWCDATNDRNYNRRVKHPYPASAERLWRRDGLYDIVVVIDYNRRPRRQGVGSAIFMHVAERGHKPTEGCVALARRDLVKLLKRIGRRTRIVIV